MGFAKMPDLIIVIQVYGTCPTGAAQAGAAVQGKFHRPKPPEDGRGAAPALAARRQRSTLARPPYPDVDVTGFNIDRLHSYQASIISRKLAASIRF
jgi:hypothetical protein